MRKPCPTDLFLMLNGTTSSLTCPLPRGTWATENPWLARDPRCHHLLRPKKWLPVASTPSRLSSMAHYCLSLLQKMAHREGTWERINQAIGERLRVRLKRNPQPSAGIVDSQGRSRVQEWAEKNVVTMEVRRSRALQAPHPGGHRGFRTQGKGPQRQGDGLGRDQDATAAGGYAVSSPQTSVGGCWLSWRGQGQELGGEEAWMECGSRRASEKACPKESAYGMG